jgi:hypothetical protein
MHRRPDGIVCECLTNGLIQPSPVPTTTGFRTQSFAVDSSTLRATIYKADHRRYGAMEICDY